jgi:hypothetical protein
MWVMADKAREAGFFPQEWIDITVARDRYIDSLERRIDEQDAELRERDRHIIQLEETIERMALAASTAAGTAASLAAKGKLFERVEQHRPSTVIEFRGRLDRLA